MKTSFITSHTSGQFCVPYGAQMSAVRQHLHCPSLFGVRSLPRPGQQVLWVSAGSLRSLTDGRLAHATVEMVMLARASGFPVGVGPSIETSSELRTAAGVAFAAETACHHSSFNLLCQVLDKS